MIIVRTVNVADPLARANVVDAFTGPGRAAGVHACETDGEVIRIAFDDAVTAAPLIDDLVAIECEFVPERTAPIADPSRAARIAARGLGDPELDERRIIETHVP